MHGTHAPGDGLSNMDNDLRIAVDLRFLALEQNRNLKTQQKKKICRPIIDRSSKRKGTTEGKVGDWTVGRSVRGERVCLTCLPIWLLRLQSIQTTISTFKVSTTDVPSHYWIPAFPFHSREVFSPTQIQTLWQNFEQTLSPS